MTTKQTIDRMLLARSNQEITAVLNEALIKAVSLNQCPDNLIRSLQSEIHTRIELIKSTGVQRATPAPNS